MSQRLPAEWEPQSAVQVTWPGRESFWTYLTDRVVPFYQALVDRLSLYVPVIVAVPTAQLAEVTALFAGHPRRAQLHFYGVPTNDVWARDHGPLTVVTAAGPCLLDFRFNGWGDKYPSARDDGITAALHGQGAFGATPLQTMALVLEGGSIETDGAGTLLTTESCLLNPNRNPGVSRAQIEAQLRAAFGVQKINWLRHGHLAGDDTDSHIDTLARLCPGNVIAYVHCDDPTDEHYPELQAMAAELQGLTNAAGEPYTLVALPWVAPKISVEGERMPATYANFLITNGAVLVPVYGDANDALALATLRGVFPGREVVGINCLTLIEQHGSLHCITMQLPAGVVPQ